jgi:hypothetical protein
VQNSANLRNALQIELVRIPSEKHALQHGGNLRKKSLGNYDSPALTPTCVARRGGQAEQAAQPQAPMPSQ